MKYTIVASDLISSMCHDVKQLLDKGWKLQGGTSIGFFKDIDGKNVAWYVQALYKEDKEMVNE